MARYTKNQLKSMAVTALKSKMSNPMNYHKLITNLIMKTGLEQNIIVKRIHKLTQYKEK